VSTARTVSLVVALVALLALMVTASGCGEDQRVRRAVAEPLLVFAAADLQLALTELADRYTAGSGRRPDLVFGSTGNLAMQIENGAPADLFFAANQSFVERLAALGMVADGSRRVYAHGRLALVWRDGATQPHDLVALANPGYRAIAIANPEHAPYGVAAREALRAAGVWDQVRDRLVNGENIAHAYQFVRTGNADAGLVAVGLVLGPGSRPHLVVPETLHSPLRQEAAVMRASPRSEEAIRFLEYVLSAEGQEVLRRYGFEPPDDD
jgi:molybdate transport system substrate-binding protein